jgi:signal transduction histidine kinase
MMPVDVFTIALVDEARGEVEDLYRAGPAGRLPGKRRPVEGSCVDWILKHGQSLRVEDFSLSETESHIFGREEDMRSGLSVLLHSGPRILGALCLKSSLPQAYSTDDQRVLESFAAHAAIAIENTRLFQQAQEMAVSKERQRLARELHDSVTQLLYTMSLLSSGWKKMAQDGRLVDTAMSFGQLENLGLQALKEMRLLIHHLRPSVLEDAGLAGALQHRLEAVEQRASVDTRLLIDGDLPPLPQPVEEQLYYIAQEALNNALRHAQASAMSVQISCKDGLLSLTVQDNGVGFDTGNSSTGIGMQSMRERAEAIAAQLHISSQLKEGTTVQVSVAV